MDKLNLIWGLWEQHRQPLTLHMRNIASHYENDVETWRECDMAYLPFTAKSDAYAALQGDGPQELTSILIRWLLALKDDYPMLTKAIIEDIEEMQR